MKTQKLIIVFFLINLLIHASAQTPENMVLIPEGSYMMGAEGPQHGPIHMVSLKSFYMDVHEVSNSEYMKFCEETQNRIPEFWGIEKYCSGPDFPDHPVVGISFEDARRYAEWAGKRLPTEAEWEYAARGGLSGQNFPNGSAIDPEMARINNPVFAPGPMPVMSFKANAYGLFDMAGNVWEWVNDWYSEDYYSNSPIDNPQGPNRGRFKVLRGGGWHSGPSCNAVYYRNALPQHWVDIAGGFRCVKDTN